VSILSSLYWSDKYFDICLFHTLRQPGIRIVSETLPRETLQANYICFRDTRLSVRTISLKSLTMLTDGLFRQRPSHLSDHLSHCTSSVFVGQTSHLQCTQSQSVCAYLLDSMFWAHRIETTARSFSCVHAFSKVDIFHLLR
jgi:hypothetical protein